MILFTFFFIIKLFVFLLTEGVTFCHFVCGVHTYLNEELANSIKQKAVVLSDST